MVVFTPSDLLKAVSDDALSADSELDKFRFDVLKNTLFKKFVSTKADQDKLHSAALDDFVERNQAMAASRDLTQLDPVVRVVLDRARDTLYRMFMSGEYGCSILTLNSIIQRGHCGPGSSRGVKHTDFVSKMFSSDLTTTDVRLHSHYLGAISQRWREAEFVRSQRYSVVPVVGSKLTSVPKDVTKNRVICTEPSLNMFYQLGAKDILERMLRRYYRLDVSKQPGINKILACAGSINGSNATIDLKNASDSWHEDLVRYLLPEEVSSVLDLIRSKYATVERHGDVKLAMFSTMGNGFTFPLMTLLFTVLLDEFLRERGDQYTPFRDGIFGDDIILPSHYSTEFIHLLEEIGFSVNLDKSFTTGFFRESCGGDYYHGYDTRGIYLKGVNNVEDIYSTFNRLLFWGVRNGLSVTNALLYLKGLVDFRPVPIDEADYAGFKIPSQFLKSPKLDENGATIYRCSVPIRRVRRVRDNHDNPHGALLGALGGYVRDNLINLRVTEGVEFKVIKCKTPSWDFIPDARVTHEGLTSQYASLLSAHSS